MAEALEVTADERASTELWIGERVERVVVHADRIDIVRAIAGDAPMEGEQQKTTIVVKARLAYRNRVAVLDEGGGKPDPVMLKALPRAHEWRSWLEKGETLTHQEIASKAGVTPGHVQNVLPLAFLAPRLTRELLHGSRRLSGGLMARLRRGIPLDWDQQLDVF